VADERLDQITDSDFDLIALPGGADGAKRFYECDQLKSMLTAQRNQDKLHAAICASPAVVLEPLGFLKRKKATSHPVFVKQLSDQSYTQI